MKFKQIIKDALFIKALVCLLLTVPCIVIVCTPTSGRYAKQGAYAVGIILWILIIRYLLKLYKKYRDDSQPTLLGRISSKFANAVTLFNSKILERLGIKPQKYLYGGDDEVTYGRIAQDEKQKKKSSQRKKIKWKSIDDNPDKIRYLYAKFVMQPHGDYRFSPAHTPSTIKHRTADTDTEKQLFDVYESVRYANNVCTINDDTVEELSHCVFDSGKKRRKK